MLCRLADIRRSGSRRLRSGWGLWGLRCSLRAHMKMSYFVFGPWSRLGFEKSQRAQAFNLALGLLMHALQEMLHHMIARKLPERSGVRAHAAGQLSSRS